MKTFWRVATPYLVAVSITALVSGGVLVAREARDQSYDRRIYFTRGEGLYYILAREYRCHFLVDDKIILITDQGPVEVDNRLMKREGVAWHRGSRTLEKIAELQAKGIIPKESP